MIGGQQAKYSTIDYGKIAPMTLDIARIKALCFDVDGTLSDTDDLYAQKIVDILPRFLFLDPMHTARRIVMWVESPGNALLGFADTIGIDDEMMAFIDWINRHRKHTLKNFLLVPGVDEMLAHLQGRYPMAIVSARDEKSTMRFLTQFDLCQYFDTIVTGLSTPHTKPYPDPILLAAQMMGVQGNDRNNIRCIHHAIDGGFKFDVVVAISNARTAKSIASRNDFSDSGVMFQPLGGNRSKRRAQRMTCNIQRGIF